MRTFKAGDPVYHIASLQYLVVIGKSVWTEEDKKNKILQTEEAYVCRGINPMTGDYNFYEFYWFEIDFLKKSEIEIQARKPTGKKIN